MTNKIYEFKTNWEYLGTDIYKIKALIYSRSKDKAWAILQNKLNEIRLEYEDIGTQYENMRDIKRTKFIFKNMSINKFEIKEYEVMEIDGYNKTKDKLKKIIIYEGYSGIGDFKLEKYKFDGIKEEWFHDDKHDYYTNVWYPSRYSK